MDSQAPMPTQNSFPYHFAVSYFYATGQAQGKFYQDLK